MTAVIRRVLLAMAGVLLVLPAGTHCDARGLADLAAFHSQVLLAARDTLPEESLKVVCRSRADGRVSITRQNRPFVSFLGIGASPALVVALTPEELEHPERNVWLTPKVVTASDAEVKRAKKTGRAPLPRSTAGPMRDWGFVFDRNQDGRVDYLSYLDGPTLLLVGDLQVDFPKNMVEMQRSREQLSSKLVGLLFAYRYAFHHVIDEDFDGMADTFVHASFGQDSSWFSDGSFALYSRTGASIDSASFFTTDLANPTGAPDRKGDGYMVPMWPLSERQVFTPKNFSAWSNLLATINSAAAKCACAFPKGPAPRRREQPESDNLR